MSGGFLAKSCPGGAIIYRSRKTGRDYSYQRINGDHVVTGIDVCIFTNSRNRAMELIESADSQLHRLHLTSIGG